MEKQRVTRFYCMYCEHELFVTFIHLPFIGHVDVICPDCKRRLKNRDDFEMKTLVFDCNCEEEENNKLI